MNPGEPGSAPGNAARHGPKPASRGPSWASSTFDGSRSPCTSPAACRARRPAASPVASVSTVRGGTGPRSRTVSASDGAATYGVASHGTGASRSASATGTTTAPPTARAAATSARNPGSAASRAGMTVTATRSPFCARAKNAPSWPSCPSSQ